VPQPHHDLQHVVYAALGLRLAQEEAARALDQRARGLDVVAAEVVQQLWLGEKT
jgi:hypothetical protein